MDLSDDINPAKDDLKTPLHVAAEKGHQKICELIISKIDDKHPRDSNDEMPLHLAADNGHFKVCKMFMRMLEDKNPKGYYRWIQLKLKSRLFIRIDFTNETFTKKNLIQCR